MTATALTPTQRHLLKMFSFSKDEKSMEIIKDALAHCFAQNVDIAMDQLWESGEWDNDRNENVLNEHLRTPYNEK